MTTRLVTGTLAVGLLAGCFGDLKFDETSTLATAPPPGSTTNMGSVSAIVDGEQFFGRLSTGATYRDGVFSFSAFDGYTRQIAMSVRIPGPGTYLARSQNSPTVSFLEGSGQEMKRWFAGSAAGSGTLTVTFLSANAATGFFGFELVPDSLSKLAGQTASRFVSNGSFNVNVSR